MTAQIQKYTPHYNLVARIINNAVYDFNGGTVAQRQDAAAFFRDEYNDWMWKSVGATVHDVIKHRLDDDPFDMKAVNGGGRSANKSCKPALKIEYRGTSHIISEWADNMSVTIGCLKARLKKWGVCDRTFREVK